MPLIYIPEEAADFIGNRRQLPDNQINQLTHLLLKKLSVKVQNNLAKFKNDITKLKKGVV